MWLGVMQRMSVHDLKIMNGRVVLPTRIEKADILVDNGRITAIIKSGVAKRKTADSVINASGCVVLPGLVDVHVHFRDPGYPQKEDFDSGSAAAAAGGVTTIADMPNTKPPTTTPKHLAEKIRFGEAKSRIDFALHSAPPSRLDTANNTNKINLDAARKMEKSGILSFKIYMPHNEAPYIPPLSSLGIPLTIHAEEPSLLSTPIDGSLESFLASRPADAEVLAIEHLLQKPLGVPLHICHLSTNHGLNHILAAQQRGISVTCEVTPHHLLLSIKNLAQLGSVSKCFPPLRTTSDVQALVKATLEGKVNLIASDHAPHTFAEKVGTNIDFLSAPPGVSGVETALPLMYTYLVRKAGLPLTRLLHLMAFQPACLFGIRNSQGFEKGQIAVGGDADLTLFNPKASYKIRGDALHGKSTYTPFENWKVSGKVCRTLLRGITIYLEDELIDTKISTNHGRFLPRQP